ncbi:MAG: hypothetical protein ABH827_02530 [bacterium]
MKKNFPSRPTLITFFTLFAGLFFTNISPTNFYETPYWSANVGNDVPSTAWSPDGKYLAAGRFGGYIHIFKFDSSSLAPSGGIQYYSGGYSVNGMAWSPDGKYIAIGGSGPTNNLQILSFNGTTLAQPPTTPQYPVGGEIRSISWSPNGKYLAIGAGDLSAGGYEVQIFSFNGTTLTRLPTSALYNYGDYGGDLPSYVSSVAWSPDGKYLAIGGQSPSYGNYQVQLFSFNGSTLTRLPDTALYSYGDLFGAAVFSIAWSPNGKFLAIGGRGASSGKELQILNFNGSSLSVADQYAYGNYLSSVAWSPNGKLITIGGYSADNLRNVRTLSFNGSSITLLTGTTQLNISSNVRTVSYSPDGTYIATGEYNNLVSVYKRLDAVDGIRNIFYTPIQWLFPNGGMATGDVQFKNGLSLGRSQNLDLDISSPIDGPINLEYSSTLNLNSDLYFGSNVSLTSSQSIMSGNGHTIYLGNNLTTIDSTVLHISSDTAIDGQNHTLTMGRWSQILVDTNVTLTLRNITINNIINNQGFPIIKCAAQTSKLALDNVELYPVNDFYFNQGQLYIHNDVIFTGTSQFVYRSAQSSFIAPYSMLTFEPNTTFYYDTSSTYTPNPIGINLSASNKIYPRNNQLINMQDTTSALYLDGCTLHVSHTGLRLTKGQLFFDNNVTLKNNLISTISSFSRVAIKDHAGSSLVSAAVRAMSWSSSGRYLAVGGDQSSESDEELIVYEWNSSTYALTKKATKAVTSHGLGLAFSSDEKYLAFSGSAGLIIYQWDGTNLRKITQQGGILNWGRTPSWSPDSKYIALVGQGGDNHELFIYQWDGSTLTLKDSIDLGPFTNEYQDAQWSPNGQYLAISGSYDPYEFIIYQWDGSTLTLKISQNFAASASTLSWSSDSRYIAVSGRTGTGNTTIYEWAPPDKLIQLHSPTDFTTSVNSLEWSPDGRYLAIGGTNGTNALMVYNWNGLTTTLTYSQYHGNWVDKVRWSPDGQYLAAGGYYNPMDLIVYKANYASQNLNPAYAQSLFFGNSALGANYDLGINLLKNSKVTVNGTVLPDNVN